jgi:hypothetical protein
MNILPKVDNMYFSNLAATYILPDLMSEKPERHCGGPWVGCRPIQMAVRLSRRDASCRPVTTHPGLHHRTSLKGYLQGSIIPIAARGVFPNPP